MTLIEERAPRMRVGIDPELADDLEDDGSATVRIGARELRASVERLLPDLDPATRTRTVLLALDIEPVRAIGLYGRTGTVALEQRVETRGS